MHFADNTEKLVERLSRLPQIREKVSAFKIPLKDALASAEVRADYEKILEDSQVIKVERIRAIALRAGKQADQMNLLYIEPDYWFETITTKINLLKEFENNLAESLLEKVVALKSSAIFNLAIIILVSLVGLLLSTGLSTLIGPLLVNTRVHLIN